MSEIKKNCILVVDDEQANRLMLIQILGEDFTVYVRKSGPEGIEAAEELLPDIILLDILMPEMDGYEVLARLKNSPRTKHIPVIFITGLSETTSEEKGLGLGAVDYITKPFSSEIVKLRVKTHVQVINQIHTIERLSLTDQLTGLPNRRSFDARFNEEWHRALREHKPISILIMDIDKFKNYNDSHGHAQGDVALKSFAKTFAETLKRPGDFAARWGGEEFIALLPDTDSKGSIQMAELIRQNIQEMEIPSPDGAAAKVTVSIGINTRFDGDSGEINDFFTRADEALYNAKEKGRNMVWHFSVNEINVDVINADETLPSDGGTDSHKKRILVVDDEQANRFMLINILTPEYVVYVRDNGPDSIEAAEELMPDIILLDILMPGMNGYEVLAALKDSERTRNIPVIFVTGLSEANDEAKGLSLGAADYIIKPFHPAVVCHRVDNQIKILEKRLTDYEIMKYSLTTNALRIALWDMNVLVGDPANADNPVTWSQEFREMLGFMNENDFPDLMGSLTDRLHLEDKGRTIRAFTAHVLDRTGKTPFDIETRIIRRDGVDRYYRFFGETLRDSKGTPLRIAGAIMDIHEKRCLAESLDKTMESLYMSLEEAKNATKDKSDFLLNMSHEIRTPMNAIIGMTAIGRSAESIEEKNRALNKIGDASSNLLGLLDDVLDMAQIEAHKLALSPVEYNLDRMLDKVITLVNFRMDEKQQKFSLNVDVNVPRYVYGDKFRLAQVITYLLTNAVKFTPEGGKINLNCSLAWEDGDFFGLRIEVADNGIGITPERKAKLFQVLEHEESKFNREYGGTGLGLVISKHIVELMDGRIWVESEPGKGAKFFFTVRIKRGKKSSPTNEADTIRTDGFMGKRVLLVEDVEINREILLVLLENTGLIFDCAENGRLALDMVEAEPGKYDLILIDIQMPQMDGLEATRRIRTLPALKNKKLPIIAMTAHTLADDIKACHDAGMDGFIGKPLDIEIVLETLGKYLNV